MKRFLPAVRTAALLVVMVMPAEVFADNALTPEEQKKKFWFGIAAAAVVIIYSTIQYMRRR